MKGTWTTRSNAFYYTGLNGYQLDKLLQKCRRRGQGKKKEWFVPAQSLTQQARQDLILTQCQQNDDILDQLAGSVDFNSDEDDPQLQELNKQLKKARKEKIQKQTAFLQERLQRRKLELYNQWSQRFFEVFVDSFGKFKNELIKLHLNQQQINTLNQSLDNCMQNMQLSLNQIWNQFNGKEQQDAQTKET